MGPSAFFVGLMEDVVRGVSIDLSPVCLGPPQQSDPELGGPWSELGANLELPAQTMVASSHYYGAASCTSLPPLVLPSLTLLRILPLLLMPSGSLYSIIGPLLFPLYLLPK